MSERRTGKCVSWKEKGFGFVEDDDTQKQYFVHFKDLKQREGSYKSLAVGQTVEYVLVESPDDNGKLRAEEVTAVGGGELPEGPRIPRQEGPPGGRGFGRGRGNGGRDDRDRHFEDRYDNRSPPDAYYDRAPREYDCRDYDRPPPRDYGYDRDMPRRDPRDYGPPRGRDGYDRPPPPRDYGYDRRDVPRDHGYGYDRPPREQGYDRPPPRDYGRPAPYGGRPDGYDRPQYHDDGYNRPPPGRY